MDQDWRLAGRPEAIQAYAAEGRLLLVALGEKPTPNSEKSASH
jgi:hypothetical protein